MQGGYTPKEATEAENPGEFQWVGPQELLMRYIREEISREAANALPGFLRGVTQRRFSARFRDAIAKAAKDVLVGLELDDDFTSLACEYAFRLVKSRRSSELLTGLVFGGFGDDDMFPTLRYLEMDGVYFGQLKILFCQEVDIDRRSTRAEVVPFAQKEMVERFMYGMDTELEDEVGRFVDGTIDDILTSGLTGLDEAVIKRTKSRIRSRFRKMIDGLKGDSRQDLLDIVNFMSKKELADMAYALVELTSQKRRFSTEEQTVGGPIDVAILTKSEGLIWIRRKHYFSPEANQGFVSRVFGYPHGGEHGGQTEQAKSER